MNTLRYGFLLLLALVLISCKPAKESAKSDATPAEKLQMEPPIETVVPVGRCRLVATITLVDTSDHRCLQYPCRAKAVVKEVKGYGSAFGTPIAIGNEISLVFEFGLAPMKRQLANGTLALSGLTVGETFQADIQGGGGESAGGSSFTVFEYSK